MKKLTKELLERLTSKYGDSFYLLDSDVFEENYRNLKKAFSSYYPFFNIAYSYKTNYTPELVRIVDRLGGYAEVVSAMEMDIALKSGIRYENIVWNGPVKDETRVKELLLNGGIVNVDTIAEFEYIKGLSKDNQNTVFNIGIRCNYPVGDGVLSRFGIDIESDEFDDVLREIAATDNIRLVCFQAHFAKRSPMYWTARAEGMIKIYRYGRDKYGLIPDRLDIGGGIYGAMPASLREQLGVPEVSFEDYASRAARAFAEAFSGDDVKPMLVIEPGTALAANSMYYVCKVENIKNVRGKIIASANGSQKNIGLSGLNPPMEIINIDPEAKLYEDVDIAGYTCIESDYLYKGYTGKLSAGDYLVFSNCGSYSLVMKPPFIFTNVPVIDIGGDSIKIIKRAETFEDLFVTYAF